MSSVMGMAFGKAERFPGLKSESCDPCTRTAQIIDSLDEDYAGRRHRRRLPALRDGDGALRVMKILEG